MIALAELLVGLVAAIPPHGDGDGAGLVVDALDVTLPIEARLTPDGTLRATAPRGRRASGFDPELGTLSARFERAEAP